MQACLAWRQARLLRSRQGSHRRRAGPERAV